MIDIAFLTTIRLPSTALNASVRPILTDAMVRLLDQMDNQPQERERPPDHMVPFPISSSTMTRHHWNRLDYWVNADGRSLRVNLDRCPVTEPGLVYLTPGGGEITARDY